MKQEATKRKKEEREKNKRNANQSGRRTPRESSCDQVPPNFQVGLLDNAIGSCTGGKTTDTDSETRRMDAPNQGMADDTHLDTDSEAYRKFLLEAYGLTDKQM